ncbi:MAG: TIGR02452 family protein, partial [Ruminococcus sp.]|nr:TIGR02452 family protein [Ruminococcus sp.]
MTEVFNDTIDMINEYPVLSDAVENSVKNTVLYKPDSEYNLPENPNFNCEITVTKCRTFEAAEKLSQKYPNEKICVLNFASATNPGGGVRTGARAQEESLCRCSTLFPCLDTQELIEKYYNFHRNLHNTLYTDMCIYTPDVFVIKTDTNIPERMTEDKWYRTDIITCAAPNLRHNPDMILKDELFSIHEKRA